MSPSDYSEKLHIFTNQYSYWISLRIINVISSNVASSAGTDYVPFFALSRTLTGWICGCPSLWPGPTKSRPIQRFRSSWSLTSVLVEGWERSKNGTYYHILSVFLQHFSMGPPHGTCGEADLYFYTPGTRYTYSRCTEQCATEYARERCGCVDAFMPGESYTVKPVCNDHLYNKMYYLWFIK